jgi:4'-phosphopantetheinyl transferase
MPRPGGWIAGPWLPTLGEREVHVWRVRVEAPCSDLSLLDAAERGRCARFVAEEERRRYAHSRTALRRLLATYLGAEPRALRFLLGPHGKPRLEALDARLRFNVSHSGELALIAVALDRELGVDVESHQSRVDAEDLAGSVCTSEERDALRRIGAGERRAAFLELWTGKEAVLKASGRGLSLSPARVELLPVPWRRPVFVAPEGASAERYWVGPLQVGAGASAALACSGEPSAIYLFDHPAA